MILINKTHLLVLTKNQHTGRAELDYLKMENAERQMFSTLKNVLETNSISRIRAFYNQNEESLRKVLAISWFCKNLDKPYQGNGDGYEELGDILDSISIQNDEKAIKSALTKWGEKLPDFKLGYNINFTYKKLETSPYVLAYSHSKLGHITQERTIDWGFDIHFKTNFGFGSSSYFFIMIWYKGISVSPFSDLVEYRIADTRSIIRYTRKYRVKNESWRDVMDYAQEAINCHNRDEREFVSSYILAECEQMVNGLEEILKNNSFNLLEPNDKKSKVEFKTERQLIEFRGEKITGALQFITKIKKLNSIIRVKDFIQRIQSVNDAIYPILKKEFEYIEFERQMTESECLSKKERYEKLDEELQWLKDLKKRYLALIEKREEIGLLDSGIEHYQSTFSTKYPNYEHLVDNYEKSKGEYFTIRNLMLDLERLSKKFRLHIEQYESYKIG
jgi:hypothetical protein